MRHVQISPAKELYKKRPNEHGEDLTLKATLLFSFMGAQEGK